MDHSDPDLSGPSEFNQCGSSHSAGERHDCSCFLLHMFPVREEFSITPVSSNTG